MAKATPAADKLLSSCACFNARSAARAITALYDRTLERSGLRTTQFAILAVINAGGAIAIQDLAAELGLDPSTMTRTLQPLKDAGFVRSESGDDKRVKKLVLTARGSKKFAESAKLWIQAQARLREELGGDLFDRTVGDMASVARILTAS